MGLLFGLIWDVNDMVISIDKMMCMLILVLEFIKVIFFVLLIEVMEKCKKVEKGNWGFKNILDLKEVFVNLCKFSLGKLIIKMNILIGCKVRKIEIISYLRLNFKNVKVKVMFRVVL